MPIAKSRPPSAEAVFSPKAVRETVPDGTEGPRPGELNELARQVADIFAADAINPHLVTGLVRLFDAIGLLAVSIAVFILYPPAFYGDWVRYSGAALVGTLLAIAAIEALDGYQVASLRKFIEPVGKAATGFTIALLGLVLIGFFLKVSEDYSRVWVGAWYIGGLGWLALFRAGTALHLRRLTAAGRLERRAVIVGGGDSAADLIRQLEGQPDSDIRICGIFDDRDDERSPPIVAGYPKLGTVPDLVEFGRRARINMLIVTLPLSAEKRVLQLLRRLWVLPVDIRLSAHTNKLRFRPRSYSYEGAVPFLDVFDKPIADWDAISKRIFDVTISLAALVCLSPVMLATAAAIRLESRGPVLFRQKRYGFNNEVIEVLKFRSMFHEFADPDAKVVVTKGDPRVTRVGRFIRKSSIDELPQLWNVVKGELSLVGPRPHAVNAHTQNRLWDEVVDGYFARHKVKPGVTGWAQINGWRGEVDNERKIRERVNCDLYYIENWSLLFDLYILMATPMKLLSSDNAY